MLQPRISSPLSPSSSITALAATLTALSLTSHPKSTTAYLQHHPSPHSHNHTQVRTAYHAAQGRANGPKSSPGKRLGLKHSATAYVVPGTIIFRQRGTKWHPGENVGLGRDHTIFAKVAGYVRYYRDPSDTGRHRERKYIGVSFEREGWDAVMPTPGNRARSRRVGMVGVPLVMSATSAPVSASASAREVGQVEEQDAQSFLKQHTSDTSKGDNDTDTSNSIFDFKKEPIMRPGEYRISNTELTRQAEEMQVRLKPFDRKDRWKAWRVRTKKIEARKLARAAAGGKKGKKAQKKKR